MTLYQKIKEKHGKPKPILFNTEMARAIIDGRKSQTRRPIKGLGNGWHVNKLLGEWSLSEEPEIVEIKEELYLPTKFKKDKFALEWELQTAVDDSRTFYERLPYQPEETLYIRETFSIDEEGKYVYRTNYGTTFKWKPSIHMPKEAARLFLKITDVRVERVQEITPVDAGAEGVDSVLLEPDHPLAEKVYELYGDWDEEEQDMYVGNVDVFVTMWNEIYAEKGYGWDENPFVWVIEFEKMEV